MISSGRKIHHLLPGFRPPVLTGSGHPGFSPQEPPKRSPPVHLPLQAGDEYAASLSRVVEAQQQVLRNLSYWRPQFLEFVVQPAAPWNPAASHGPRNGPRRQADATLVAVRAPPLVAHDS